MRFDYEARITRLIALTGVDAVAIVPGANMAYFTGVHMHLSERPTIVLFSDTGRAVIVPELEVPVWSSRPDLKVYLISWTDEASFAGAFQQAIERLQLTTAPLGVDGQTMRVFEYRALQTAGAQNLHDVGRQLLDLRAIKTSDEVDAMRTATTLSEQALHRLIHHIKPGMTEREIAAELDRLLAEAGSDGLAFPSLIQTGPNSAIPHGNVSNRVLQSGEFLLIDFGGKHQGYPADITRTFCLGQPTDEMRRIYDVVRDANRAGVAACQPGATAGDVDQAARQVIDAAGYGEYFIHRTGHGLGLETHEQPNIAPGDDTLLQAGMVFTVEPGVYVPGLGGVRVEDNVHITETGAEVLTKYPYDWIIDGKDA
jgi:Xaa-Pro dipeptidase